MAKRSKNIKFSAGLGSFNGDTFQRVIKNENAYTKIRVDDVDPSWGVKNARLKVAEITCWLRTVLIIMTYGFWVLFV